MCEMSPEPIYIGPLITGEGLQHVIMPGRCRNGRGERPSLRPRASAIQ